MKRTRNPGQGVAITDEELMVRISLYKEAEKGITNNKTEACREAAAEFNKHFAEKFGRTVNYAAMYHAVFAHPRGRELAGLEPKETDMEEEKNDGWTKIDISDIKRGMPKGNQYAQNKSENFV